jgi:hypothetical protein
MAVIAATADTSRSRGSKAAWPVCEVSVPLGRELAIESANGQFDLHGFT